MAGPMKKPLVPRKGPVGGPMKGGPMKGPLLPGAPVKGGPVKGGPTGPVLPGPPMKGGPVKGRAPAQRRPIAANTGTRSTKAPLQQALRKNSAR